MNSCVKMTPRQRDVYNAITASVRERGYSPTTRELAAAIGISSYAGVIAHVAELERKGVIRVQKGVARGIQLVLTRDTGPERALLAEAARVAPIEAVRAALAALPEAHHAA